MAVATAGSATAAMPGAFNQVQCYPGQHTIIQEIEAYRNYLDEWVALQGALVNLTTGAVAGSQWVLGEGGTANSAISWSNVSSGEYLVFYRWATWDGVTQSYMYSGWVQLFGSQLSTFGQTETYQGSGVYISPADATGRCSM
jgi:hypothetical protein